jgi:hypothetical protein
VSLSGDRLIHDVIGPRQRSAPDDVTNTHPFATNRGGRRLPQETLPIGASMEAEAIPKRVAPRAPFQQ